jgi:hypothetical protein
MVEDSHLGSRLPTESLLQHRLQAAATHLIGAVMREFLQDLKDSEVPENQTIDDGFVTLLPTIQNSL